MKTTSSGTRTIVRIVTTDQKGAIAETAIGHAAVKLGIDVYRPIVEGGRYDLIFNLGARLLRIQCKWAKRRGSVVAVRCSSCRRTANGLLHRTYTAQEIDAIAAFCPDTDRCYFLPVDLVAGRRELSLRLDPTRNGQKRGIRWADDFDFTRLDWERIAGP
ncbi:MAG: group I intron-associated PD-(D/E)XK endonuclease [Gaiellaceae bacterium]